MGNIYAPGRFRKISLEVTKDYVAGVDRRQVPASGVTVTPRKQGATVREGSTVTNGNTGTVKVYGPNSIAVGDILRVGTAATPTVQVDTIVQSVNGGFFSYDLGVTSQSDGNFVVSQGDRLVVVSPGVTAYHDAAGQYTYSSITTDSDGAAGFFARERFVDLELGGAISTKMLYDQQAGSTDEIFNVMDYGGSIKAAIAAASRWPTDTNSYGQPAVYIPAGYYILDSGDLDINVDRPMRIYGDGPTNTVLHVAANATNLNKDIFILTSSYITIEEMRLIGGGNYDFATNHPYGTPGSGVGVRIATPLANGTAMFIKIRNMRILAFPGAGIRAEGLGTSLNCAPTDFIRIENCEVGASQSDAQICIGSGNTVVLIEHTRIRIDDQGSLESPAGVYGIHIKPAAQVHILNCDGNPTKDLTTPFLYAEGGGGNPEGESQSIVVDNCDFESWEDTAGKTAPCLAFYGTRSPTVRNTLLHNVPLGILFSWCFAPRTDNCNFSQLGSVGAVKLDNSIDYLDTNSQILGGQGSPQYGASRQMSTTYMAFNGNNPGWSLVGSGGITVPQYANETMRDTALSNGIHEGRARPNDGTIIWVASPGTNPSSHLQVYYNGAWVGIARQAGGAI